MKRQEFSKNVKLAALKRAMDDEGHIWCELCGGRIAGGNGPEYHHIKDAWVGGSNDLSNVQVICKKPCHSTITAKETIPQVAKTKRIANKRAGIKTPKGRPLPGTKRSGLRRRMDGTIDRW